MVSEKSASSVLVPAIRFEGFSGEWYESTLSSYSSKIGDGLHGTPEYTDNSGIYFINGNNLIYGSILITDETKQVSELQQTKDDISLTSNTILISINGTIGNLAWYRGERVMLGKSVAFISLEGCDSSYTYSYLQTTIIKSYFFNNLTGSTIRNLGLKAIREARIALPRARQEQTKIGQYFQQLDTLIAQHQQKHDKLLNLKKSLLEKMFPKQGTDEPAIRFKGFSGAWEEKRLSDLADIVRGASPRPIEDPKWFDKSSDVGWLRIRDVTEQDGRIYHLVQKISKLGEEKTRVLTEEHLLLSIAASVGKPVINYVKTGVHDGFLIFRTPSFNLEFMYQWLKSFEAQWHKYGQPGSQVNLNSEIVKNQEISIPESDEQKKIGNLFQQLDTLITQHQTQLKKLTHIKQACLAKLFV